MIFHTAKAFMASLLLLGTFAVDCVAEDVLLEDYEGGGLYDEADWANAFEDEGGNRNAAWVQRKVAMVDWATKWSGLPSTGPAHNLSRFKTFQVDVRVAKGQPVEEGANFYFQLNHEADTGYSYWEKFVPQSKVPADGKWYRVQFAMETMDVNSGEGGAVPGDFKTIIGTTCGMTYDEDNDYEMKQASFDNVKLTTESVDGIVVALVPDSKNSNQ